MYGPDSCFRAAKLVFTETEKLVMHLLLMVDGPDRSSKLEFQSYKPFSAFRAISAQPAALLCSLLVRAKSRRETSCSSLERRTRLLVVHCFCFVQHGRWRRGGTISRKESPKGKTCATDSENKSLNQTSQLMGALRHAAFKIVQIVFITPHKVLFSLFSRL